MTRRGGRSIGTRLLTAQCLVLVATIGTVAAAAAVLGTPLFHQHLLEAGHGEGSFELTHIEMAYREASLTALGVAAVVAIGCSLVVSWFLSRRLQQPLGALAAGATDIAGGHWTVRLPDSGAGPELDAVTSAFAETRAVLQDQVGRLSRLVTDLRDVSAADEGHRSLDVQAVAVTRLLATATDAAAETYRAAGVTVTAHPVETAVEVYADPDRMAQVLGNLLSNALRHSPSGSTVEIRADVDRRDVTVVVADHGDGIPAAQLPHVFERFYRGDTARDRGSRGSGIGLTISRAIVQAHGGTIRVDSPGPGRGTVVALTLPRADRPGLSTR